MEPQLNCPKCGKVVAEKNFFCSNCGKQLKNKPEPVTAMRQILVYLLSLLLPPLGLWPAIKYLRQKDVKSRVIGFVAIVLTIISASITIWLYLGFMNKFNQLINQELNSSLYDIYR